MRRMMANWTVCEDKQTVGVAVFAKAAAGSEGAATPDLISADLQQRRERFQQNVLIS